MSRVLPFVVWLAGCGLTLDLGPAEPGSSDDGGVAGLDAGEPDASAPDGAVPDECATLEDWTECNDAAGERWVCHSGICKYSYCGDGIADAALLESCDDGNLVDGDGCDADCRYSCTESSGCDDATDCNGAETCAPTHQCVDGVNLDDGTRCFAADGTEGSCRGGVCAGERCGDGNLDPGEQCDDGDTDNWNGCANDCTHSCTVDADCPSAPCRVGECQPDYSCSTNAAPDLCNRFDDDCDGMVDEDEPPTTCRRDVDGDGWGSGSFVRVCGACPAGFVSRPRVDCWDAPVPGASVVNPGQTMFFERGYAPTMFARERFDYDCDGTDEPQYPSMAACALVAGTCSGEGWLGPVPGCGQPGTWATCGTGTGPCLASTAAMRVQACR